MSLCQSARRDTKWRGKRGTSQGLAAVDALTVSGHQFVAAAKLAEFLPSDSRQFERGVVGGVRREVRNRRDCPNSHWSLYRVGFVVVYRRVSSWSVEKRTKEIKCWSLLSKLISVNLRVHNMNRILSFVYRRGWSWCISCETRISGVELTKYKTRTFTVVTQVIS